MTGIQFRFYEELGEFLPPERRKLDFHYASKGRETVKHAIEACGVPHTEVELILVNGASVGFDYLLRDGDRVSVYPRFETFDITPLLRVREKPLRQPRFVADAHLGGLARYLRMLGYDTLCNERYQDVDIAAISARDGRIVLTRDRDLLMHRIITHGRYVRAVRPRAQLIEVVEALDLAGGFCPFTLCMACNAPLRRATRDEARGLVPADTLERFTDFSQCTSCERIYWRGSHYRRMRKFIDMTFLANHAGGNKLYPVV